MTSQDPAPQPRGRRRRAVRWRGDTPTGPLPMGEVLRRTPYRDPRVSRTVREEREAVAALDLALGVGETLVRCGAGAAQVESSIVAVLVAAGLADFDIDITLQSVIIQCRTPNGAWVTRLRVVRDQRRDFARLALVHELVDDLVSGRIDLATAGVRAARIASTPRTWSSWVVALASGALAAGVAMMLGAGAVGAGIALISALAVERFSSTLAGERVPDFYRSAAGGFLATLLAWTAYALGYAGWLAVSPADYAAIMAGGIVALLPARSIASAMEDVVMGYPVTGTSRIFAVLFHLLGLILGVAAGLAAVVAVADLTGLGVSAPSLARISSATAPLPVVLLGAAIVGLCGAVSMQSRRRFLLPSAALTATGVMVAWSLGQVATVSRITAVGVAATLLGFLARIVALRMRAPAIVLAVPASFGLLPGLAIFVGLYRLMVPAGDAQTDLDIQVGMQALASALGVLVAIATGTTLGDILAAPLDRSALSRRRGAVRGPGET